MRELNKYYNFYSYLSNKYAGYSLFILIFLVKIDNLLILHDQFAKPFIQAYPLHHIDAVGNIRFAESQFQIGAGFEAEGFVAD